MSKRQSGSLAVVLGQQEVTRRVRGSQAAGEQARSIIATRDFNMSNVTALAGTGGFSGQDGTVFVQQ
jgi:hypothetical protein